MGITAKLKYCRHENFFSGVDLGADYMSRAGSVEGLALSAEMAVFIPNRTFLVRFGGISGEFGRAMVRILARRSRAKIPMVRPNVLDMLPKLTKKVRLGIYRTQIRPKTRRFSVTVISQAL